MLTKLLQECCTLACDLREPLQPTGVPGNQHAGTLIEETAARGRIRADQTLVFRCERDRRHQTDHIAKILRRPGIHSCTIRATRCNRHLVGGGFGSIGIDSNGRFAIPAFHQRQ